MDLTQRVLHRHLRGAVFKNLNTTQLIFTDGGIVTCTDVERLLRQQGIDVGKIVIYRADEDPPNLFGWEGVDSSGSVMVGTLTLHLAYDSKRVVVSAEVTENSRRLAQVERRSTASALPVKQRLMLISSVARRAIADLRERPDELDVVVTHLVDIVELAEQDE